MPYFKSNFGAGLSGAVGKDAIWNGFILTRVPRLKSFLYFWPGSLPIHTPW